MLLVSAFTIVPRNSRTSATLVACFTECGITRGFKQVNVIIHDLTFDVHVYKTSVIEVVGRLRGRLRIRLPPDTSIQLFGQTSCVHPTSTFIFHFCIRTTYIEAAGNLRGGQGNPTCRHWTHHETMYFLPTACVMHGMVW